MRKNQRQTVSALLGGMLVVIGMGVAVMTNEQQNPTGIEPSIEAITNSKLVPPPVVGYSDIPASWMPGGENGIFADSYLKAYARLLTLTPEERAGQIFLIRCPRDGGEEAIRRYHPGGFVLFREDFALKTKDQVTDTIASYQAVSTLPMLMAVDEEGGTVVRISSNPLLFPYKFDSPQKLYKKGGIEAIEEDIRDKSALLRQLGLNLNLAPVADISQDTKDYIYPRTLGESASKTAEYISRAVRESQKNGISSTLKHFPGYGNNENTHTGISLDQREYAFFLSNDFLPFRAGIKAGAETVLVSHNIVSCMDKEMPASLSAPVHTILREELGFTGVIMTDDLYMDAIRLYVPGREPAVTAVLAGNDLLISTEFERQIQAVLQAQEDGIIPREMVDRAAFRVLAMKYHTGLLLDKV